MNLKLIKIGLGAELSERYSCPKWCLNIRLGTSSKQIEKKSPTVHDSEVGALVAVTPRHGVQRYRSKLSCFQKQLGLFKKQKQERRRVPTVTWCRYSVRNPITI